MRKIVTALSIFPILFVFAAGSTLAQESAGQVERVSGVATSIYGSNSVALERGSQVFRDDVIETGEGARLEIRFSDGSSFTLGENARIVIDEFVYAPAAKTQQQAIEVFRGVFKFTTGAIGKVGSQSFSFKTPVATIGVRGTTFIGGELTVGMPVGMPHYGFQIKEGAIEVTSPGGSVVLDEPGEGTFLPLSRQAAPTPVRQWTPEEAAEADAAVAF